MNSPADPRLKWQTQESYDERTENVIAHLLWAGVVFAALVVIWGALPYLMANFHARVQYHTFQGEPAAMRTVDGILHAAFSGQPRGIMQLGLLILIGTPIARVVFSIFAFAVEGDRMYVMFTMVVLAVLLYSLFGSFLIA